MALQSFVDKVGPVVSAAWLNAVDVLKFSIFADSTTKAQARTALTSDAPMSIGQGGTGSTTAAGAIAALGGDTGLRTDLADPTTASKGFNLVSQQRTAAEIAAGVTPLSYQYLAPDLRRYSANIFSGDQTTAINNAILAAQAAGGTGYIYHPGGKISHSSTILFGSAGGKGLGILGFDRTMCEFDYIGTGSAWRATNNGTGSPIINTSGYGKVLFRGVKITTASGSNVGAAIELNACGYSFYDILECWISGTFLHGVILDGTEVTHVERNIIENSSGTTNGSNVWLVGGSDRTAGQNAGFTNSITICDNQLNIGGASITAYNILDDGGSNHDIFANNCNGASIPIRVAAVLGLNLQTNEIENALAGAATGNANILFMDTTAFTSTSVGACQAGEVSGNFLGADMVSSASESLRFQGTAFHQGINVFGNWFRANLGAAADIDVTKLASSTVGPNYSGNTSGQHYTGVHNNANGNILFPPQNGSSVGFTQAALVRGDTRFPDQFFGGVDVKSAAASLQIDAQKYQSFTIDVHNAAGTLQSFTQDNAITGAASSYADRVTGQSNLANTLPTNMDTTHGFTAGWGLLAADNSILIANTAAQSLTTANVTANIAYYDGNAAAGRPGVICGLVSRNINGVTAVRLELRLINAATGAAVNFDTTLLPNGKAIQIAIQGYLA
jgi:hypothetical protein